jgi:hypothetical protein
MHLTGTEKVTPAPTELRFQLTLDARMHGQLVRIIGPLEAQQRSEVLVSLALDGMRLAAMRERCERDAWLHAEQMALTYRDETPQS